MTRLVEVLDRHDRALYFGLGARTNLAEALHLRPDLAPRVELVQMGPSLPPSPPRAPAQYNARIDPTSFGAELGAVRKPTLLLSGSSWGAFPRGRQELGVHVEDPLGVALSEAPHPALTALARHLQPWVASGKS